MRVFLALIAAGLLAAGCDGVGGEFSTSGEGSDATCRDGIDNDGDGKIDCGDPDCYGYARCDRSGDAGPVYDGNPWRQDGNKPLPRADGGRPSWPVCVRQTGEAKLTGGGQVDIIWFVDTSGSMFEETAWVQQNLNNFAKFMGGLKLDYRVVMVAEKYWEFLFIKRGICVPPPLGGPKCTDGPRYRHIKVKVGSTDGLMKLISTYPQWSSFIRKGSTKNFVAVTDDNSRVPASWFEAELRKRPAGGFKGFVFHSIVAFGPDPRRGCPTGARYGRVYEQLSKKTKGSMFQVCLRDWKPIFSKLAQSVAKTVKPPCSYKLPTPPRKQKINPRQTIVTYTLKGKKSVIPKVSNAAACGTKRAFYFNRKDKPDTIIFCPELCKSMKGGKIEIVYGCLPDIG